MSKAQFLDLPWNVSFSAPAGQETAHGVPVHALAAIEVRSYTDAEYGKGDDITLYFNNGALPAESKGNAAEVLEVIHAKKAKGLSENQLSLQSHKYMRTAAGGIGEGWIPAGEPQTMSVPDFLKRTV